MATYKTGEYAIATTNRAPLVRGQAYLITEVLPDRFVTFLRLENVPYIESSINFRPAEPGEVMDAADRAELERQLNLPLPDPERGAPLARLAVPDGNPKTRLGMAKVPLALIPGPALVHMGEAFRDGAVKYGPANWRDEPVVTALEDLGPQELETTTAIVSAYRNSKWRSQIGGDWPVVAELVRQACSGTKCQTANDLWNVVLHDPKLADAKADLCELSLSELCRVSIAASDIGVKGAAALVLMGRADWCDARAFDYAAYFGSYSEIAPVQSAILAEAFRLTRVPLAGLMLPLVMNTVQSVAQADDSVCMTMSPAFI